MKYLEQRTEHAHVLSLPLLGRMNPGTFRAGMNRASLLKKPPWKPWFRASPERLFGNPQCEPQVTLENQLCGLVTLLQAGSASTASRFITSPQRRSATLVFVPMCATCPGTFRNRPQCLFLPVPCAWGWLNFLELCVYSFHGIWKNF